MTAPGTLLMAKMLVPGNRAAKTAGRVVMSAEEEKTEKEENLLGAISRGTTDGLASGAEHRRDADLLSRSNRADQWHLRRHPPLHRDGSPRVLRTVFGAIFAPVAWVIGIPWHDCRAIVGNLLGTRMVLNELVAFSMLGPQKAISIRVR